MRILLAEDDPNIRAILQVVLEKMGHHTVISTIDGEQALAQALTDQPDLLILDGMMPKKTGIQVCQAYRQAGGLSPVIFLSAKSQPADIKEFLRYGTGYIQKPFDPLTVLVEIEEILMQLRGHSS